MFNYYTTDIDASYQFVRPLQAFIIYDIKCFDDFAYFIPTATS
ncbi:hypothetical protein RCC94_05385 [Exiguobacterium acetylicum]|nr:hypothetical protein [Exiguobacterium acetylicum]MDQ6466909.1 hypothetical protein [Exiguobacterium acetylicum]